MSRTSFILKKCAIQKHGGQKHFYIFSSPLVVEKKVTKPMFSRRIIRLVADEQLERSADSRKNGTNAEKDDLAC
jgi:hypothetical protein